MPPAGLHAEIQDLQDLAARIHTAQQSLRRRTLQDQAGPAAAAPVPTAAAGMHRPGERRQCITRSPSEPAGPLYRAVCTGVAVQTVDSVRCPPGCGGHPICGPCLDLAIHRGLVTTTHTTGDDMTTSPTAPIVLKRGASGDQAADARRPVGPEHFTAFRPAHDGIAIVPLGGEGELLTAYGHHDPAAFLAAAIILDRRHGELGLDQSRATPGPQDVEHTWALTLVGGEPGDDWDLTLDQGGGPVTTATPGAFPVTVLDLDQHPATTGRRVDHG